jgi:hypothetical protein
VRQRDNLADAAEAFLILRKERQVKGPARVAFEGDLGALHGLQALSQGSGPKLRGHRHRVVVGDTQRRHAQRLRAGHQVLDVRGAVPQAVLAVAVQLHVLQAGRWEPWTGD